MLASELDKDPDLFHVTMWTGKTNLKQAQLFVLMHTNPMNHNGNSTEPTTYKCVQHHLLHPNTWITFFKAWRQKKRAWTSCKMYAQNCAPQQHI
jgi:hypothetical protein